MVEVTEGPRLRGALATALEQRRDRYNAAFAQARHTRPRLDAEAFSAHLCDCVGPIVEGVAAVQPAAVPMLTEVLYDLSLEMLGTDLLRRPEIDLIWRELLPSVPHLLGAMPRRLVGSLCNAAYQLANEKHADAPRWLAWMRAAAPSTRSADALLAVGQGLAWRCGLAHYREGALDALTSLPVELAAWTLEIAPSDCARRLEELRADRWQAPRTTQDSPSSLRIAARCGGFRGFGELFSRPPMVSTADDQLYVSSGMDTWFLTADVFGTTFHRTSPVQGTKGSSAFTLERDGTVHCAQESRRMAVLAGASSWVATSDTLAVTVPTSHFVYLVARTRG